MSLAMLRVVALCAVVGCAAPPRPTSPPSPDAAPTIGEVLASDPAYARVAADATLATQFDAYWRWIGELGTPDAAYLASLPPEDLERTVMLYHEKVELAAWLALGHRFEDVMRLEYFQAHYEEVYPVAHRDATVAELELLDHVARRYDLTPPPPLALVLVSPMVERRDGVTPAMMTRRLRFNPDLAAASVTATELEAAARVWEAGGYVYRDRAAVLAAAAAAAASSVAP